jgi:hypothetical protein
MATHHFLPPDVANVASTGKLQQHYEHAKQVPELCSVCTHTQPYTHADTGAGTPGRQIGTVNPQGASRVVTSCARTCLPSVRPLLRGLWVGIKRQLLLLRSGQLTSEHPRPPTISQHSHISHIQPASVRQWRFIPITPAIEAAHADGWRDKASTGQRSFPAPLHHHRLSRCRNP